MHALQVIDYIVLYMGSCAFFSMRKCRSSNRLLIGRISSATLNSPYYPGVWLSLNGYDGIFNTVNCICYILLHTLVLARQGLSTMSRVSISEDQPNTLGHSQSVMNIPRMSPTSQMKKRRAPALPGPPPVTVGHANFDSYQVCMCMHEYMFSFLQHWVNFPSLASIG